jgi:hypothetical protein
MRSDSNDVWIEVERDEMVTLTPGFNRQVTLRWRQPPNRQQSYVASDANVSGETVQTTRMPALPATAARHARLLRSPKLQCESGRLALRSS